MLGAVEVRIPWGASKCESKGAFSGVFATTFFFLLHLFAPCHTGSLVDNYLSTLLSRLGGGFGFVGCRAGVFDPPSPFFSFVFLPVLQKMGERGLRRYILG